MASKKHLNKIKQLFNNEENAIANINANVDILNNVIDDYLSRTGLVPTEMQASLDMNSNRIINLGGPVSDNDAVRYKDVKDALEELKKAKGYAQDAENAATRADTSASNAKGSEQTAVGAASDALDYAQEAKDWACKMDGTVDGSNYSSKYYALEAQQIIDQMSIANCRDVSLTSLQDEQVLKYDTNSHKWKNGNLRQTYRGTYNATTEYRTGDIVVYGTNNPEDLEFAICVSLTTGHDPSDSTRWRQLGNTFRGNHDSSLLYHVGDLVRDPTPGSEKFLYLALQEHTDEPLNDTDYWIQLGSDFGLVEYEEKSDNSWYSIGMIDPYEPFGPINFTPANAPVINASTGTMIAPELESTTQSQGDNSTKVATTKYVDTAVAGASSPKETYTNPALTSVGGVCTWTVTHTLGSRDFVAIVYDTTTYKEVMFEGIHTDTTTFTINLTSSSDIASGAYKVVMIG